LPARLENYGACQIFGVIVQSLRNDAMRHTLDARPVTTHTWVRPAAYRSSIGQPISQHPVEANSKDSLLWVSQSATRDATQS
jgi:hypothetical protein